MAAFNFHRRRTRHWWYVGATLVAAAFFAVFFVAGAGAVSGSPSGFESGDGDMVLTSLDGSHTDWNCFVGSDNFQPGTPNPNCKVKTGASHVTGDASGEVQWVPGQKFDILCPALNNGNNPPKDEFTDLTEFDEVAGNGDLFFYGSAIRSTANGNTSGDVEFNQKAGDGVTTAGCRTAGDRLVAYDFLNGGTTLSFHVLTYIDAAHPNLGGNNGTCFVKTNPMPCWGATVITVASNLFDGQANQSPITAANNGISGTALAAQQWSEFGVNLTQALGASSNNPLPCFPQQVWESRSSGSSFVSNPQDIEFLHVSTCGSITIIKHTDPRNLNQNFSYSASGGNISPTSFKLNDQSALTISAISTGTTTSTITTATNNGFAVGDTVGVTISGSNSTPKVDGPYTATITGANTFTIPLAAPVTTAGTAGSATTNTELYPQLSAGSYTVNEGAEPPGFSPESLTCVDSGGNSTSTSGVTASISVAANGSTVCTYVNHQNLASMKTQVSSTSVFPGNAVHDTATVTGNNPSATPSGDVTFYLCGPLLNAAGCSSSDSTRALVGTGTLSGSGGSASADSPNVNAAGSELGAGIYCFEATWPGDNNYPAKLDVTSATNECFTVGQIRTTTVTTPSVGPNGVLVGSSVSDNAVITALQGGGGPITGTVTFYLCSPSQTVAGACPDGSGTLVSSTTSLTDRGTAPPSASADSASVTVHSTGTWCWRAVYDPGSNHNYIGSKDANSSECFLVNPINTTTVTTPSVGANGILVGSSVTDNAVIAAVNDGGGPITGTVTFYLCNPSQTVAGACPDGSGTQISSTSNLTDLGTTPPSASANSDSVTVHSTGTWCWRAVYDPGSNHNYTGSEDARSSECFLVNPIATTTVTTPSVGANGILVGSPVTDNAVIAAVNDGGGPITGTVTFYLCDPTQTVSGACPDGSGTLVSSTTTLTDLGTTPPSASAGSDPVTVHSTGTWCWRAVYDPGSNHNYTGSEDARSSECFLVNPISTTTVTTPSVGQNGLTTFGSSVSDNAVISATHDGGGTITGTVTFYLCNPFQTFAGACPDGSGTQVSSTTSLTDRGTTPPSASADSDPVTVNLTGTWCWRAVYDPGSNHNYTGSEDAGSTECFLVTDTTTSTSQQVWYPNDSASVSADASGDTISGTLTLQLYTGADCVSGNEVAGQLYSSGDQTGTATISVDSNKQTSYGVSSSANVSWKVVFTSDDPNVAGSHHCENSSVTITN